MMVNTKPCAKAEGQVNGAAGRCISLAHRIQLLGYYSM